MATRRRRFTAEFKEDAVRLLKESGRPLDAVARELGVDSASLFEWREQFAAKLNATGPLSDSERAELEVLRKENKKLKEEKDILKKAAAFFAKESEK